MEVFHHLDVAEALGPHDAQYAVRLADADLKVQPSTGDQGVFPLAGDSLVEVQEIERASGRERV